MKTIEKTYSRNSKKIAVISLVSLLLIIAAGGITYAILGGSLPFSPKSNDATKTQEINLDTPTEEQTGDGNTTKDNTVAPVKTPPKNDSTTQDPTTSITLTAKNQNDTILQIRAQINSVDNSGTCTLTLSDGSQTITRTAGVQALASVSTCQGFDINIPSSGLKTGTWSINLAYSTGTVNVSTTDMVTVK